MSNSFFFFFLKFCFCRIYLPILGQCPFHYFQHFVINDILSLIKKQSLLHEN